MENKKVVVVDMDKLTPLQLMAKTQMVRSFSEGRRLIHQGAVTLGDKKITVKNMNELIGTNESISLCVGKKILVVDIQNDFINDGDKGVTK